MVYEVHVTKKRHHSSNICIPMWFQGYESPLITSPNVVHQWDQTAQKNIIGFIYFIYNSVWRLGMARFGIFWICAKRSIVNNANVKCLPSTFKGIRSWNAQNIWQNPEKVNLHMEIIVRYCSFSLLSNIVPLWVVSVCVCVSVGYSV